MCTVGDLKEKHADLTRLPITYSRISAARVAPENWHPIGCRVLKGKSTREVACAKLGMIQFFENSWNPDAMKSSRAVVRSTWQSRKQRVDGIVYVRNMPWMYPRVYA